LKITWVTKGICHCILLLAKMQGTSQAKAMSNSKKIKPVVLAIVELHLSEGRQLFHSKAFFKAFFDPNQY